MSEEKVYSQGVIDALIESNETLQGEVTRLRENSKTLRAVIRALRATNESLRSQVSIAAENDETFKAFCAGEFDAKVVISDEGGLPESEDGGPAGVQPR